MIALAAGDLSLANLGQQTVSVVAPACLFSLIAVAITVIFGLSRFVNFALGDLATIGCYVTLALAQAGGVSFIWGLAAAALVVALVSVGLYFALFQFTLSQPINGFLISLGLVLLIENGIQEIWGQGQRRVEPALDGVVAWGSIRFATNDLVILGVTVVLFVALVLVMRRTRLGIEMRASAGDPGTAALLGIPVRRVTVAVFVIGGILAGAAGALIASTQPVTPQVGYQYVLMAFVIALAGGLGNIAGAVLVAIIVAVLEAAAAIFGLGPWQDPLVYVAMLLILLFRPSGLIKGVVA